MSQAELLGYIWGALLLAALVTFGVMVLIQEMRDRG